MSAGPCFVRPSPKGGSHVQCIFVLSFVLDFPLQLPYNETSTSSSTVLSTLGANEDVADMRDTYEADLVQLVANLGFTCGRA